MIRTFRFPRETSAMALAFDCTGRRFPASSDEPFCGRLGPLGEALYDYWLDIHPGDERLPGRQHFDPVELASRHPMLLQHLWLVDVEREPRRFRLRLVGSSVYMTSPFSRAGDCIDEFIDPATRAETLQTTFGRLVESRQPEFRCGRVPLAAPGRRARPLARLSMPLAADGRTVDMIVNLTTDALAGIDGPDLRRAG